MFKQHIKLLATVVLVFVVIGIFFVLSNNLTFALQK